MAIEGEPYDDLADPAGGVQVDPDELADEHLDADERLSEHRETLFDSVLRRTYREMAAERAEREREDVESHILANACVEIHVAIKELTFDQRKRVLGMICFRFGFFDEAALIAQKAESKPEPTNG